MVEWHQQLNGHEFEQTLGDGEGQGSLGCCSPWGHKESDMTERLNNNSVPVETEWIIHTKCLELRLGYACSQQMARISLDSSLRSRVVHPVPGNAVSSGYTDEITCFEGRLGWVSSSEEFLRAL